MTSVTITWVSMHDDRVCPICEELDGYSWTFETGVDNFPTELIHPALGVVWSVHLGSEAHGHSSVTCRCGLDPTFDFSDLLFKVKELYDGLVGAKNE